MRECICGEIDSSPCASEPYCRIKGTDYDCEDCTISEREKSATISVFEESEKRYKTKRKVKCRK